MLTMRPAGDKLGFKTVAYWGVFVDFIFKKFLKVILAAQRSLTLNVSPSLCRPACVSIRLSDSWVKPKRFRFAKMQPVSLNSSNQMH